MYKAEKINNKRKTLDRYKSVFGFAIGSPDLYDWIRENPGVVTYPISYCNDPSIVGKIDNFVSKMCIRDRGRAAGREDPGLSDPAAHSDGGVRPQPGALYL